MRGRTASKALWNLGGMAMRVPVELDPDVDDEAPTGDIITVYDERHYVTYLRLLDAKAEGADWMEVARIVLHRDPVGDGLRLGRVVRVSGQHRRGPVAGLRLERERVAARRTGRPLTAGARGALHQAEGRGDRG